VGEGDASGARTTPHRVVILGGGFAGLEAAKRLSRRRRSSPPVEVVLVDRRNYHLFQPLLYQVATGGLSPGDVTMPLRAILARRPRVSVLLGEAVDLDPVRRRVVLADGEVAYDTLMVATGTRHHYFGHPEWEDRAPGLKTIEDATTMRSRILSAFERAERTDDATQRERLLTFVVVGGGPTGVELAGAVAELAKGTMSGEFRRFRADEVRILLVEGRDRLLPPFDPHLSARAARSLSALGVEIETEAMVAALDDDGVTLVRGDQARRVSAATVLWAAGVAPSKLARVLERRAGAPLDRGGRVEVTPWLTLPDQPAIFVLGDLAHVRDPRTGVPLPGTAPVAMQQGRYAAEVVLHRLRHRGEPPAFRFRDRGQLAVIGRAAAVAELGRARFSGYPAWLLWLFVHITYLVGFENRVLVLFRWAYNYLTRGRGSRLITRPWAPGDEGPAATGEPARAGDGNPQDVADSSRRRPPNRKRDADPT
jgi:NADH dehydrogenase